jgi:hypothetical protein
VEDRYRVCKEERSKRVEGIEPVKMLLFRYRVDNFVSPPRKEGMGPIRQLLPRCR